MLEDAIYPHSNKAMTKDKFFKIIELEDRDVVVMLRGAGEDPERIKVELATTFEGIFMSATVEVPAEKAQDVMEAFDEETAQDFVDKVLCVIK